MNIYCDAGYRSSQIGLVGDEDDVYIFQCLLQEAIYLKLCEGIKVKSTFPEHYPVLGYISGVREIV